MNRSWLLRLGAVLAALILFLMIRGQELRGPTEIMTGPGAPVGVAAPSSVAGGPVSRPAVGFRTNRDFAEHYAKHVAEFGGIGKAEYLRRAQSLRDRPAGGDVLELVRADGVITRFDRATGDFLAVNPDGTIRTYSRPNAGEDYFQRQAARGSEAP